MIHPMVRVCERYPPHWKRFDGTCILVYPASGEWRAATSENPSLPLHATWKETFMQRKRSVAGYRNKEDAEQVSLESVNALDSVNLKSQGE